MTDKERLRAAIKNSGIKLNHVCDTLNISYPALKRRLDGETEFTGKEVMQLSKMLGIRTLEEVNAIFFNC